MVIIIPTKRDSMNKTYCDKQAVKNELEDILLKSTFADSINFSDKISDIITFQEDLTLIKERIKDSFNVNINHLSDRSVNTLLTTIYLFLLNSGRIKPDVNSAPVPQNQNLDTSWAAHIIFYAVISRFKQELGRFVAVSEPLNKIKFEMSNGDKKSHKFDSVINDLESLFGIQIKPNMRICNILSAAKRSWIKAGKVKSK